MTKMAAMPIYGKILKNLLLRNQKADDLESCYEHRASEYYQVCSNNDPGLTLTYFGPLYFCMGKKGKTMDFSETIVVCDIKVGRCC